jgi:phosphatidylglycerol:prolipoprotein diacylglycerol transferase
MLPILFRLGSVPIRTYTVLMYAGLLAGLALAYWLWRRRGLPPAAFLDMASWTLLGGVVGGRAFYVALNWEFFGARPAEALAVWTGGMSYHGAFAGALLALALYALASRQSFWRLSDAPAAGLALGNIFGWAACLAGGCAYGVVGRGPLFLLSPDIYGIEAPRFAVQIAGALQSAIVLAALLLILRFGGRPGLAFGAYLMLYFGGQAGLELLRGDETLYLGEWRLEQVIDAGLALAGLILIVVVRQLPAREKNTSELSATSEV